MPSTQLELDIISAQYNQHGDAYIQRRLSGGLLFNEYIEAPVVREFLSLGKKLSGARVLDIGCGPGVYTRQLLKSESEVVAIDSSEVMLNAAKKYCSFPNNEYSDKCEFILSTFESYNPSNKLFDWIFATFMLGYFSDLTESMFKMRGMLEKNGRIIASMLHPMRLFAKNKDENGYTVVDYFSGGNYEADFLKEGSQIKLKRYNFEQLSAAFDEAGLKIIKLCEPSAQINCGFPDQEKVDFYSRNPSIVVFLLGAK